MTITTIGSGIGGTFLLTPEGAAAYGVVVGSPTWITYEPTGQIVAKKVKNTKQSSPLAAGRLVDMASRRVVTSRAATLSAPFDWCQANKFTTLLNQLSSTFAAGAAGTQGATAGIYSAGARLTTAAPVFGYTHTFRNNIAGRSAAIQVGVPTTDATLRQYDVLGAKPTKFAWSIEKDAFLTCATDWDARILEDPLITTQYEGYPNGATQTPYTQATPSYSVANPWHFAQAQVQIGATPAAASSATPVDGVTKFAFQVEHPLNTSRFYLGNAGLKDEQIVNAPYKITGTVTSDFVNKTYWADAFYSDTAQCVLLTFSAGALAGNSPALQFVFQNLFLDNESPTVANDDIVNTSFPFTCLYDLANEPLTAIVQSTDATV